MNRIGGWDLQASKTAALVLRRARRAGSSSQAESVIAT
jgi:hypothetical protein